MPQAVLVAPLAGAWIETPHHLQVSMVILSHPSRVRGLKLAVAPAHHDNVLSHPSRVRGLKRGTGFPEIPSAMSHPSRVRGLKQARRFACRFPRRSHPSRVRGLKLRSSSVYIPCPRVAPLAGAWIETGHIRANKILTRSHPSRVRGLKHPDIQHVTGLPGRTPRGCVD